MGDCDIEVLNNVIYCPYCGEKLKTENLVEKLKDGK